MVWRIFHNCQLLVCFKIPSEFLCNVFKYHLIICSASFSSIRFHLSEGWKMSPLSVLSSGTTSNLIQITYNESLAHGFLEALNPVWSRVRMTWMGMDIPYVVSIQWTPTFKGESRFHGAHVKVGSGKVGNYFLSVVFLKLLAMSRGTVEIVFDW